MPCARRGCWSMSTARQVWLTSANYELPQTVAGVQIDCPITKGYLSNSSSEPWGLEADARLRLWPAGSPLMNPGTYRLSGQAAMVRQFHADGQRAVLRRCRRAAEEPQDLLPLRPGLRRLRRADRGRGRDRRAGRLGPDREAARLRGHARAQPRYDVVYVLDARGWYYRYSHFFSIDEAIRPGVTVRAGQRLGLLGKEGGSGGWSHLHFDIFCRQPSGKWGCQEAYAFVWEAYQRQYQPQVDRRRPAASCGLGRRPGARWTPAVPGAPTGKIARYEWTFTDGSDGRRRRRSSASTSGPATTARSSRSPTPRAAATTTSPSSTCTIASDPSSSRRRSTWSTLPTFGLQAGRRGDVQGPHVRHDRRRRDLGLRRRQPGGQDPLGRQRQAVGQGRLRGDHAPLRRSPGHYLVRAERTDRLGQRAVGYVQVRIAESENAAR